MINIKDIDFMSRDEAIAILKAIHLSNAPSEKKEPLILACEKRISNLNFDSAVVVKAAFDD